MKKILPLKSALGCALIFMMIGASIIFNDKEIILPEMAALAIGCLIHQNPVWLAKPLHIFLLPSITAIGGFMINKMDVNPAAKLILAVMFVLLTLRVFKSGLAPALATGLLPVITNATSLYFIFSILTLTLILALSLYAKRGTPPEPTISKRQRPQDNILYIVFVSAWVLTCAQNGWMYIAAIPPVLVVGYESMHKEEYTFKMFYKQVVCLSLAAYIGIQSLYFLNNLLLATLMDIVAISLLMRLVAFKLTPAYAMSLLPMVLHRPSHQYFYWNVFVMACIVLGTIYSYKNFRFSEQLRVRLARVSRSGEEV
ncbi:hypothetical protein SAMN05192574_103498 [Mucilaginibacter gossypiicola]|uniref:HPP family protein n=1 Tax=Mucilaginibacter gossypiicola TaxID=551995 RepID=A0A1H8HGH3_9SPHI|nr:hypothetical protein [Mucilaginibacter gossypiicola]SEN55190.1 hypothetical protein SAMN05192574_103498 [Mucilaginibacter gossypiicola]